MRTPLRYLLPIAALFTAAAAVAHWVAGWGLVTIHADNKPLALVIPVIARQAGVEIRSTLPPQETLVTLHFDRAPLAEVMETLAVRTDSRWGIGYFIGRNQTESASLSGSWEKREEELFAQHRMGMPSPVSESEVAFDPRKQKVELTLSGPLSQSLDNLARHTEAAFFRPQTWDPTLTPLPLHGSLTEETRELAVRTGGYATAVLLLSGGRNPARAEGGDQERRGPPEGGPPEGFGRGFGQGMNLFENPEAADAILARAEQRIAQMPPEDQEKARQEARQAADRFREMAALTPEERRERMREMMQNPVMQARMEERMTAQDFRRTPEQRRDRYQRYHERKTARKEAQ